MRTIQISIPKPCHEDWALMTQQEKGRFCDKCCKTVVDFSSKTPKEIQQFIAKHQHEKLCGRFRNEQLRKPVRIDVSIPYLKNRLTISQSFYLSLLIAFGATLFSCTTHNNETIGEFNLTDTPVVNIVQEDSIMIVGELDVEKAPLMSVKEVKTLSEIKLTSDSTDESSVNRDEQAVTCETRTVGRLVFYSDGVFVKDTSENTDSDVLKKENEDIPVAKENFVYPNPAHDLTNLRLNISETKSVSADLFDINGKLIRTVIPLQQMQSGESDIQLDISNLPPATYFLYLVIGEKVETKRIVVL